MAYEKNTWASGDVVTSAKLNHMENGIEAASSPYDVIITFDASASSNLPELVKGDYSEAVDKILSGTPLYIAFSTTNDYDGYGESLFVYFYAYDPEQQHIVVSVYDFSGESKFAVIWNSDNSLVWND